MVLAGRARSVSVAAAVAVSVALAAALPVACNGVTAAPLPSPDASVDASTPGSDDSGASDGGGSLPTDDGGTDAGGDAASADADADATDADAGDAATVDAGAGDAGDAAIDAGAVDAGPPTFSAIYDSIIEPRCNYCHGMDPPFGGSNLQMGTKADAYADLVNQPAAGVECGNTGADGGSLYVRVVPGHAADSLLYQKVSGVGLQCGSQMPLDDDALDLTQVRGIEAWINAGAPND